MNNSAAQKAHNDLYVLGLIGADGRLLSSSMPCIDLLISDALDTSTLKRLLGQVPGGQSALSLIEAQSDVRPEVVGEALRGAYGLHWAPSTTAKAGTLFRVWARQAGVFTSRVPQKINE